MDAGADWPGLQTLVCQQTTRWVAGKVQQATRYFLSSLAGASAATLAGYIRGHWGIENQQHWHLDVTFAEDACQCRRDHAPRNLSTMRKLALTLLRRLPLVMSLKRKRKKTARDDQFLLQLLAQLPQQEMTPISELHVWCNDPTKITSLLSPFPILSGSYYGRRNVLVGAKRGMCR